MGVLMLAATVVAACEGDGFLPPGQGTRPSISSVAMAPDSVVEGETLTIAVVANGQRTIEQVNFQFRGASVRDTTITVSDATRALDREFTIAVPFGTGPDSLMSLDVSVVDAGGLVSDLRQDTVFVVDATRPKVTVAATPQIVGTGDAMQVAITAEDARGLASIGYAVVDKATGDTAVFFQEALPAGVYAVSSTYAVPGPVLDPTTLLVTAFAEDRNALVGGSGVQQVGLEDRLGPQITLLSTTPDSTVPLGDSIQVRIEATDPSGIRSLIFVATAARGDTLLGTDTVVTRFDQELITFPRPGESEMPEAVIRAPFLKTSDDSTSEAITVVVLAEDGFGNISEVTKNMYVGGPDVSLIYPTKDVAFGVGQSFEVRVRVSDHDGIDSAKVFLGGALNQQLYLPLPPRTDTPFVTVQTINLPATEGTVTLSARAWNLEEVAGVTQQINIAVLEAPPADVEAPVVSVAAEMLIPGASQPRMELKDILRITVTARDEGSSGLERVGFKAIASRSGSTHVISGSTTFGGSNSLEQHEFAVPLDSLYALFGITSAAALDDLLPDDIDLRIHGFAADAVGLLACSVGIEEQRVCTPDTYTATGTYEAADTSGLLLEITAVRGHTILLANRDAVIADLALDTIDSRLFLSNISHNLVEVVDLAEDPDVITFLDPVQVGSQPWGLFVGERVVRSADNLILPGLTPGDTARTLIVGNSGGTNLSLVHLDANAANVQEVDFIRLSTPNSVLWHLTASTDAFGRSDFGIPEYFDFSDRPQFLAQDSLLRIVYSTTDTEAANGTTLRYAHPDPDPTSTTELPEALFFLTEDMIDESATSTIAIGNLDFVDVDEYSETSDTVELFSHEPGYPDRILRSGRHAEFAVALESIENQIDSVMTAWGVPERASLFYPVAFNGAWRMTPASGGGDGSVVMSDTTFVSASGDRGRIVIGEGAAAPTGRIILWFAQEGKAHSSELQITDLISNASEQVLGVGLNWDGSMGLARGLEATYFFTADLRLQGLYQQPEQGGAGAVFHPDHNSIYDGGHTDADMAGVGFTGTPSQSVEVVNTFHFNKVNELHIRDNIMGPLKAGPPLPADNAGLGRACVGDDCVVAKLYGITEVGGVVIINVRRRDLINP
ncbi:MAG: hypothetical protein KY466_04680 [Gemmatimonadetes bacterium]|nr:hypothetical protein [Gemmatimonadota bacterium]